MQTNKNRGSILIVVLTFMAIVLSLVTAIVSKNTERLRAAQSFTSASECNSLSRAAGLTVSNLFKENSLLQKELTHGLIFHDAVGNTKLELEVFNMSGKFPLSSLTNKQRQIDPDTFDSFLRLVSTVGVTNIEQVSEVIIQHLNANKKPESILDELAYILNESQIDAIAEITSPFSSWPIDIMNTTPKVLMSLGPDMNLMEAQEITRQLEKEPIEDIYDVTKLTNNSTWLAIAYNKLSVNEKKYIVKISSSLNNYKSTAHVSINNGTVRTLDAPWRWI